MNKTSMYGYPVSSIILPIIGLTMLTIILLFLSIVFSIYLIIPSMIILPIIVYAFIEKYPLQFISKRNQIIREMIGQSHLTGNETILDIGTGSGFVATHYAKHLSNGLVIGIDKFDLKNKKPHERFFEELKINFFGKSVQHAINNITIEQVKNTVDFIKTDLTKPFPFKSNTFNLIVSSQFLYCIHHHGLKDVLEEIHRVLCPHGTLVFFESIQFMKWNIHTVQAFYEQKGYKTHIIPLHYFSNKCIFVASPKH